MSDEDVGGPANNSRPESLWLYYVLDQVFCSFSIFRTSFWLTRSNQQGWVLFLEELTNRRARAMIPAAVPTMSFTSDGESENRLPLDAIFAPRTVAVIGATERQGSVGRAVLWNLISNPFGATVYPINLNRPNVLGIKAYKNIASVPDPVDLAVVITPAATVPAVINECVKAGVMGAIVISAGFKETGPEGARLEQQVLEEARRGRMRIIGPNCVGVMRPYSGMNATFAAQIARPGSVGFISQSGALCTATLDWSFRENVGFSAFISVGSMLDVGWGDLIDYLGDDPYTKSIVIYMESIGDCAIVPVGFARGGADQADHRDQGGPDGSGGQGSRVAHRVPDGQRRGPRRRVPARGGAPGQLDLRSLRHGRGAVQAAAAQGTAASDPDQRRRPRRPGNRCADRGQGGAGPDLGRDHGRARAPFSRPPGATTTRSTSWAMPTPSAMPRRWRSQPRTPTSMGCWRS